MDIITLDFETYFDDDYTLKKMTTEAYIRDPRFELLGCGVIFEGKKEWYAPNHFADWVWTHGGPLSRCAILCHHAQFDGLILSHHYNAKPARWLDTFSMARYLHGAGAGLSLEHLAKRYGIGQKTMPYDAVKGCHWADLGTETRLTLANGCLRDCELTLELFTRMLPVFPPVELPIIDTTIRMFTEPKLIGDTALFAKIRDDEALRKNETLYALGVSEKDLASSTKFTAILEARGVEVPTKQGKNGPIPAIAKTDQFMRDLLEDGDEQIATLAQARLDVRSTINETRSGRLHDMSARGPLPIYLNYCGAHTRRWSGGDSVNLQNLPRGSAIRRGLRAPVGWRIASPDQSQGECRLLNWFAGQADVVERFRRGDDPYIPMASWFYGVEPEAVTKAQRQTGKVIELASGFGMGAPRLKANTAGGGVALTEEEAARAIKLYRTTHPHVAALWREGDSTLYNLWAGKKRMWWRSLEIDTHRLIHPNGTCLDYRGLEWEGRGWHLHQDHGYRKIYGAMLVENVIQWLSRIITAEAMARYRDAGYDIVGMSHDDVWLLVPEETDPEVIASMMAVSPSWAPDLPLAAGCKIGETYS